MRERAAIEAELGEQLDLGFLSLSLLKKIVGKNLFYDLEVRDWILDQRLVFLCEMRVSLFFFFCAFSEKYSPKYFFFFLVRIV